MAAPRDDLLQVVLLLPTGAMLLVLVLAWSRLAMVPAVTCDDGVCAFVPDPIVTPGDAFTVEVGVFRGLAVALDTTVYTVGDRSEIRTGPGPTWGDFLNTGSAPAQGSDVRGGVVWPVPADWPPGTPLTMDIQASWVAAVRGETGGTFRNEHSTKRLVLPVVVVDANTARRLRVQRAAGYAGGALAAGAGLLGVVRLGAAVDPLLHGLFFPMLLGSCVAAWTWAGPAAQAALDAPSGVARVVAAVAWMAAVMLAMFLGWRLVRRTSRPGAVVGGR
jgi:hypothetical protein